MATDWTMWGMAVQTVAGFLGAHAAASAAHEHRFGFLGHSLAGLFSGALSGAFLQSAAVTVVTGSGTQNASTTVELVVIHLLTGAVAGGILMFVIGFIKGAAGGARLAACA